MKNNILLKLFFYITFLTILSGCVSKGLPAPKSETDTMIVVPIVIIDGRKTAYQGETKYTVYMDNIETGDTEKFTLSTSKHGYYYLKDIPEGTYSIVEYKTEGLQNDKKYDLNFSKYLDVKAGEITVFPGKLTVYIYDDTRSIYDGSYLYFSIREIDNNQISRIESFLKTEENFKLW